MASSDPCKPAPMCYPVISVETTAGGFGDLIYVGGQPPQRGFFTSVRLRAPFLYGGSGGAAFGLAGANVPVRQPRCQTRHPSFGDERRVSTTNVGGRNA